MNANKIFEQKFHFLKQLINSYQGIKSVVDFDEYISFFVFPFIPEEISKYFLELNKNIEVDYPCITIMLYYDKSEKDKKYEKIILSFEYYTKINIKHKQIFKVDHCCLVESNLIFITNLETQELKMMMRCRGKLVPFSLRKFQRVYNECNENLKRILEQIIFENIDNYFIKDIKKDLQIGLCGISYNFEKMVLFHNRKELLEKIVGKTLPSFINKYPLQKGYALALIYNYVDLNHFDLIRNLPDSFFIDYIKKAYKINKIKYILCKYYEQRFCNKIDNTTIIEDFIDMYIQLKIKIPLKINSYSKIVKLHNLAIKKILAKKKNGKLLKIHEKYNFLIENLDKKYEVINSYNRLKLESTIQHHCVVSYESWVNNGDCIIVSFIENDKRYTIEIQKNRKNYIIKQFLGICNTEPEEKLVRQLAQEIAEINKKLKKSPNE